MKKKKKLEREQKEKLELAKQRELKKLEDDKLAAQEESASSK